MQVNLIEIISRSEQGMTRPFLCRADDGGLYYVKGRYAGYRSLCREWVACSLGKELGLPMPDFCIAEVPSALAATGGRSDAADLGSGLVFASRMIDGGQEITIADVPRLDQELKRTVLLFDWWVRNEDRTLTNFGGNPNLMLTAGEGHLRVFDMNLAFDETFDEARFWQMHVFNGEVERWPDEFIARLTKRLRRAMDELPGIWAELPEDWRRLGGLDFETVELLLGRHEGRPGEFWAVRR